MIGAGPHERTDARTAQRNGHRARTLTTTAGDLELQIPKLRTGSFFPSLLERRRRVDQALFAVVMEAYLHGVSHPQGRRPGQGAGRRHRDLQVRGRRGSARTWTTEVAAFRGPRPGRAARSRTCSWTRPTARPAVEPPGRAPRPSWSPPASRADGRREVLGFDVGDSEDGAFWTAFLRSLKARGLAGVQLVISDAHAGLKAAIARGAARRRLAALPGALHAQRAGPGPQGPRRRWSPPRSAPSSPNPTPSTSATSSTSSRPCSAASSPRSRRCCATPREDDHRVRRLPRRALEEDLVHQPARAAQQGDQTPHRRRRRLPQPRRPAPPRRRASWSRPTTNGRSPTAATSPKAPWPCSTSPPPTPTKEVATQRSSRHSQTSTTATPHTTASSYTTRWDVTRGSGKWLVRRAGVGL